MVVGSVRGQRLLSTYCYFSLAPSSRCLSARPKHMKDIEQRNNRYQISEARSQLTIVTVVPVIQVFTGQSHQASQPLRFARHSPPSICDDEKGSPRGLQVPHS